MDSSRVVSRRVVLRLGLAGAGATLLAACSPAPPAAAPTTAPASTTAATAPTSASKPAATEAPTTASAPAPAATATPAAAAKPAEQPKSGGTLRLGIPGDIPGLDGHLIVAPSTDSLWIVWERLTAYNAKLEPQPMLAESWDWSTDNKQLKLNLRKGVQFHSGREFTSDDVLWNLDRVKDPKVGAGILASYRTPLTSVEAPDKYTVMLRSDKPWPAVFDFLQLFNIVDKDTMPDGKVGQKVGGTGPFAMTEWLQGDHLTFVKNKNYWQSGKPYLDGITAVVSPDPQAMVVRFEAGDLDIADNPLLNDVVRLKANPAYQVMISPNPSVFLSFFFNTKLPPFDRKEVRQALNYAIDRKRIVDTVMRGISQPEDLPWAASSPAYDVAKNNAVTFDLEKAKSLLAVAGVSNLQFEMVYPTARPEQSEMAPIYQADLAKIGVNVTLKAVELPTYLATVQGVTYQGMATGQGVSSQLHPQTAVLGPYHSPLINLSGYKNDDWTKLVDDISSETDPAKQKALNAQISDFLLDQAWNLPVSHNPNRNASKPSVHGLRYELHEALSYTDVWLG